MCCAPCSVYPVNVLEKENVEFEGFFYNPNIHPIDEFERRKSTVVTFSQLKDIKVHYMDGFMQNEWESFEGEEKDRCFMCYEIRMDAAALFAKENGFDAFTTSLLVSPYQKHDFIRESGERASAQYGVRFYYRDFREGFREGQNGAREMGLYRQKYCGCILSLPPKLKKLQ